MKATMRDVAKQSGVSLQSVSNVLNGRTSQMREETRLRILQSIRDLNYQPNVQARGLRLQCTKTMAFLTIDPAVRFLSDPFHVAILSGMVDTLRQQDYGLLVQGFHPDQAGGGFRRLVHQRRFDGAVVHLSGSPDRRSEHIEELKSTGCPFVLIEDRAEASTAACVLADNQGGAAAAVALLQAEGHQRIGFLATDRLWPAVEKRITGYEEAIRTSGGRWSQVWGVDRETVEGARSRVEAILRDDPAVTAILCANDVLAVGAIQAARQLGRKVPTSLSIIGFGDNDIAQHLDPPLTTVALPGVEMGGRAAELLLAYIQNGKFDAPEVVFPTKLIRRGSA
ncbi:MAG: LacI family DNA-binding transcriptional regulator [Paludisphaera borealis]|uniref:LacI family DNA-binding transcriptional regulator n=1 Tax=Paludisphaera borealis TaxID=1387353 RepID=UPI0028440291|nr:LacI family DNA-binding transcriptional regulator [Paludisphaera borealis]MDR3621718.1 LacI family DNA-binding transcriptional regulator [Paludisphaera borealis]